MTPPPPKTNSIRAYYQLSKPGIVYGNALTATAGFAYASHGDFVWVQFFLMLFGLSLVIASASATNNYLDVDIDSRMERTKGRPLVAGSLLPRQALTYAAGVGLIGFILLSFTTPTALITAFVGWIVYVALYTPLKRVSPHALFVGAIAGATPPVVGYTALTGSVDTTAAILFAALFVWQIPHFLAIAVYRYKEYTAAGVPLYIKTTPTERQVRIARKIFYATLLVLPIACFILIIHR